MVKTRYQKKSISAIIEKIGKRVKVILEKPQRAVTEGQSAVFYDFEGKVLGGGIIKK